VIAARLSEDDGVLLLEAGSRHPSPAMAVPPAWPSLQGTPADWADTTVPQAAAGEPCTGHGDADSVDPRRSMP
jgi:choline dehydrogenase